MTTLEAPPPRAERWTAQWKELYAEVITTGLCTGCAGCVVTCPHDVIGYEHAEGKYVPFHLEEELGPADCIHGVKGCTTCTRACPRFRSWEPAADLHLFGRVREPDELSGIWRQLLLTRAADDAQHAAAVKTAGSCRRCCVGCWTTTTSRPRWCQGSSPTTPGRRNRCWCAPVTRCWPRPAVRYTYCANPLALREAKAAGPVAVWRWSGWAAKPSRRR